VSSSRRPPEKHLPRDERRLDRAGHHSERFGRIGRVALTTLNDMSVRLIAFTIVGLFAAPAVSAGDLRTQLYASGFVNPVAFVQDPTDRSRQFVVEQGGHIRIISNGAVMPGDFLNLSGVIVSGGERGLLGMAFAPDYAASGRFFVNFTRMLPDGVTLVTVVA